MTDIIYKHNGLITTFSPVSEAGEAAVKEIEADNDGSRHVLWEKADMTVYALRHKGLVLNEERRGIAREADYIPIALVAVFVLTLLASHIWPMGFALGF